MFRVRREATRVYTVPCSDFETGFVRELKAGVMRWILRVSTFVAYPRLSYLPSENSSSASAIPPLTQQLCR